MSSVNSTGSDNTLATGCSVLSAGAGGCLAYKGVKRIVHKPILETAMKSLNSLESSVFKDAALEMSRKNNISIMPAEQLSDVFYRNIWYKGYRNITKDGEKCYAEIEKLVPSKLLNSEIQSGNTGKLSLKILKPYLGIKGYIATKWYKHQEKTVKDILSGKNAASIGGIVYANTDKASASLFHEAGHVKNFFNKFGKSLQLVKNPFMVAGLVAAYAGATLISPNNKNKQAEQSFWSKTKEFLKKNCVGIAALSSVPLLLEEGMASIKGSGLAKKELSKDVCKLLNRFHGRAWLTYAAKALALTVGVFAADKIRNYTSKPVNQ